ncbi:MAG: hypothetical protein J6I48_02255 [Lachnospira sp.]|nr:hypothetical protein [Lachnospira sp.]
MENNVVWPISFCVDDNEIWFIYDEVNLCRYNLKTRQVEYVDRIAGVYKTNVNLFFNMHKFNDIILLVPTNYDYIVFYNIKLNEFKSVKLKTSKEPNFISSYEIGEYIYLIPFSYSYVIRISKSNLSINYYMDLKKEFEDEEVYFNDSCIIKDGIIGCVNSNYGNIYLIDIINKKSKKITIGKEYFFDYITYLNDEIVLVDNQNNVIVNTDIYNFNIKRKWTIDKKRIIVAKSIGRGYLLLNDIFSPWIGVYNFNGEKITELYYDVVKRKCDNPNYRGVIKKYKEKYFFYNNSINKMQIVNGLDIIDEYALEVDEKFFYKIIKSNMANKDTILENELIGIRQIIKSLER